MSRRERVPGSRRRGVLYVLPAIADELADDLKNALAVRNASAIEGRCPECGAVGELTADAEHEGVLHYRFEHEDGCSALRVAS